MNEYYTVKKETEYTVVIEKSKFIAYIKSIENEDDAKSYIEEIRKRHSLANHSCYAFIADDKGLNQKFSDAGEPQGTAGLPILNVLKNKRLYKTIAVVVRYFGGIKLGTGGLTRAYGGTVSECIENAKISHMVEAVNYEISTDYDGYSKLLLGVEKYGFTIIDTDFNEKVKVFVAVKNEDKCLKDFDKMVSDIFKGNKPYKENAICYRDFGDK